MKLSNVKKSDILKFYEYLYKQKNFSVGSIQLYQNLLYPSFQVAVDDNMIRVNPCRNCMKDYVRGSMDSPKESLSKEEQASLLQFLKTDSFYSKHFVMFAVMLGTGIRISEAIGLTWDNIDFKNHEITIDHQVIYRKINGVCRHYATPTKNKKSRVIPMQKNIVSILETSIEEWGSNNVPLVFKVDGYKQAQGSTHTQGFALLQNPREYIEVLNKNLHPNHPEWSKYASYSSRLTGKFIDLPSYEMMTKNSLSENSSRFVRSKKLVIRQRISKMVLVVIGSTSGQMARLP